MNVSSVTTAPPGAGFARRAEALHDAGDSADAHRLLTAGVRRFPGDVTALLVLARVCRESDRVDEARDWIDAALRLDPGCPAALMHKSANKSGFTSIASPATPVAKPPVTAPMPLPTGEAKIVDDVASPTLQPVARVFHRESAPSIPSVPSPHSQFVFPVREEEEEPEIDENSAPHVATVTLAEIYLQQGLKEQAAQIYRQLLERNPEDDSVRRRLDEILREIEGS